MEKSHKPQGLGGRDGKGVYYLPGAWVQFLLPISEGSRFPVTPVPWESKVSAFAGACTYVHIPINRGMHALKPKPKANKQTLRPKAKHKNPKVIGIMTFLGHTSQSASLTLKYITSKMKNETKQIFGLERWFSG